MNVNLILKPRKVLKFGEIELVIEGNLPSVQQYIEELMYLKVAELDKTGNKRPEADILKEKLSNGREYIKRLISCSVREVRGLSVNEQPFNVSFKDNKIKEIDDESYDILLTIFDSMLHEDIVLPILEFYGQNKSQKFETLTEIEIDDKKKV
jgi:hypothetical protein